MDEPAGVSDAQIKEYAENTASLAGIVSQLVQSSGWQIFLALYELRKREIKNKSDYESFEDFKADRRALDIVDGIVQSFEDYQNDAKDAAEALLKLTGEDTPIERGIMLIEHVEGASIEG